MSVDHSRDEIAERFRALRSTGDRNLRNALIEDHRWIAIQCARRFAKRGEPLDDLIQVAQLGLLKAVERFDPDFGVSFSTFAMPTVTGELRRHFRDGTWALRVPRRDKELHLDMTAAVEALTSQLRRAPRLDEIAEWMKVSIDDVHHALEAGMAYRASSLNPRVDDEEGAPDGSTVGVDDAGLASAEVRVAVRRLMAELPARERRILFLRFFEGRTQSEIAEQVGMSQVHVSRLLRSSMETLKRKLSPSAVS